MESILQRRVRFGDFELDPRAGELHKNGQGTVLQEQQLKVLLMLIEQGGEIVTRDDIKKKLWPNDTVVEFEHSINTAIRKLRRLLDDSADAPKYIETIARRGYRLMVAVEWVGRGDGLSWEESSVSEQGSGGAPDSDTESIRKAQLKNGRLTGKGVSHYRVLEVIGGGGMGLVYRAEDLKLGRPVALKFLPEEVGDDLKARERFEREAHAVSSLNHPNVCTIYDFDEHEGHLFIAMELLPGKTLREHLSDGRFRLSEPEGLEIAIQIALGLEAAHEKGIIHRDIKPANIFITEKNVAKILDFGVAKILAADTSESHSTKRWLSGAPEEPSSTVSFSETSAAAAPARETSLTLAGTELGTAGYMSPEQIGGEQLDARTDIFSCGLVLYEMSTGQRAFTGETAAVVRDGILNDSPAPLCELNSTLPVRLVETIDRCLEKDREQRYQSAGAIRSDLTQVLLDSDPHRVAAKSAGNAGSRRFFWRSLVAVSVVFLLVAASISAVLYRRRTSTHVPYFEIQNMRMSRLTDNGKVNMAAISPDGRYVAYALREPPYSLWLRQVSSESAVEIVSDSAESFLGITFSPDGADLYFVRGNKGYVMPTLGGTPKQVIEETYGGIGVSPDGTKLAFVLGGDVPIAQVLVVNRDGTDQHVIAEHPVSSGTEFHSAGAPSWSPDGRLIAVSANRHGHPAVNIYPAEGGTPRVILLPGLVWRAVWLPDQSGFLLSLGSAAVLASSPPQLWLQAFPSGKLQRLTNDLDSYRSLDMSGDGKLLSAVQQQPSLTISISPASNPDQGVTIRAGKSDGAAIVWLSDGTLLTQNSNSDFVSLTADGRQREVLFSHGLQVPWNFSVCRDGHLILGKEYMWKTDMAGRNPKQLTASKDFDNPDCSPGSDAVIYVSQQSNETSPPYEALYQWLAHPHSWRVQTVL